ncbi:MAG: hypothetical protein K2X98_02140 [Alphaproteobacteria bacterium]|nr:hypothetical protein [Alphaproteobacteria bacterium]
MHSHTFPYESIKEIFPNVFMITEGHAVHHEGIDLQHSCNMVIIRNPDTRSLTLINTVRPDAAKFEALDALGPVENIIRIGAFHDSYDGVYCDHYSHAKLWALKGMTHKNQRSTDVVLEVDGPMPFPSCSLFVFKTSQHPEGALLIDQNSGILVTCDSVKNWVDSDIFFNKETASLYQKQGFYGTATISHVWINACHVDSSDFKRLEQLPFHHLLSAHGKPLLNDAHGQIAKTMHEVFNS